MASDPGQVSWELTEAFDENGQRHLFVRVPEAARARPPAEVQITRAAEPKCLGRDGWSSQPHRLPVAAAKVSDGDLLIEVGDPYVSFIKDYEVVEVSVPALRRSGALSWVPVPREWAELMAPGVQEEEGEPPPPPPPSPPPPPPPLPPSLPPPLRPSSPSPPPPWRLWLILVAILLVLALLVLAIVSLQKRLSGNSGDDPPPDPELVRPDDPLKRAAVVDSTDELFEQFQAALRERRFPDARRLMEKLLGQRHRPTMRIAAEHLDHIDFKPGLFEQQDDAMAYRFYSGACDGGGGGAKKSVKAFADGLQQAYAREPSEGAKDLLADDAAGQLAARCQD